MPIVLTAERLLGPLSILILPLVGVALLIRLFFLPFRGRVLIHARQSNSQRTFCVFWLLVIDWRLETVGITINILLSLLLLTPLQMEFFLVVIAQSILTSSCGVLMLQLPRR